MSTQAEALNEVIKLHKIIQAVSEQRDEFAGLANSLACIIIDGDISSNDIDLANEVAEKVLPYLI